MSETTAAIMRVDARPPCPDVPAAADTPVPAAPVPGDAAENAMFGIDAFTLDDRLRLFHFAAAAKRPEYLCPLRAFHRASAHHHEPRHAPAARQALRHAPAQPPGAARVPP